MVVDAIRRFFDAHHIGASHLLAAVSGGYDSTALLAALTELRGDGYVVTAAHVNHHLRGEESDGDETYVRDLCARFDIPLHVADGTLDPSRILAVGIEAAAREVRHARLHEICGRVGARFIATAHQQNDQAETIVMRLITGSGLAGLRGIHPLRDDGVIRPLLDVRRTEIAAFLDERGLTPRVDRSNADPRFLRNRIRRLLKSLDPPAVANIAAIADKAAEQWALLQHLLDGVGGIEVDDHETRFTTLPDDPLLRRALLHRHIHRLADDARDVSSDDLARLANELDQAKRIRVTKSLELVRREGLLVLRRLPPPVPQFAVSLEPGADVVIDEIGIRASVQRTSRPSFGERDRQTFELPRGAVAQFVVRNRRRGDRFQPLGFPHEKKLKDVLIDRKIAADSRDRIPLLLWNDQIVWIAGVEVSERFKVTSPAGELYEVRMEGAGASG